MAQVYDYLEGYADFYESKYKWKLNVGLCYSQSGPNISGHIIVGMAQKISQYITLPTTDLSELKWVVFDECDKILHDLKDKFVHILKTFATKDQVTSTNVLSY
jgi:superfamily II DNA/RNA helicase